MSAQSNVKSEWIMWGTGIVFALLAAGGGVAAWINARPINSSKSTGFLGPLPDKELAGRLKRAQVESKKANGFRLSKLDKDKLHFLNLWPTNDGWDFRAVDLRGAMLCGSLLYNANFSGANLCGANLDDALLDGANFTGAQMDGHTSFRGARLYSATLDTADLKYAILEGAYYNPLTKKNMRAWLNRWGADFLEKRGMVPEPGVPH
jgi:uncharacterized protein YjbI with pentapeptide repeats